VLISAAGIFLLLVAMIAAALYVYQQHPEGFDVSTPSLSDLASGVVSVVLGNLRRYGASDFVRAICYLLILASLILSFVYYRMRAVEAAALPEGILWVDETQDVVGRWNRLSLASFLAFQWVTLLVPAVCIMLLGSFERGLTIQPWFFVICLPSMMILIAAGIDGATKYGTIAMGILFVVIMAYYDMQVLKDKGAGISEAAYHLKQERFSPKRDVLIYVTFPGVERPSKYYLSDYPATKVIRRTMTSQTRTLISDAIVDKDRMFVIYHNDVRKIGKVTRYPVREWMRLRPDIKFADKIALSEAEPTLLYIYERIEGP
jgi:hypothetical protein